MNPRLVFISGPLKGTVAPLTEEDLTIGRDASSELNIQDLSLSRKHCKIIKDGDHFKIIDLESLNGTFVDRVPVRERILEHESQIEIGDSVLLFLEEEPEKAPDPVQWVEEPDAGGSTIQLRREDAMYLFPARMQPEERTLRDLNTLLKLSTEMSGLQSTFELGNHLLNRLLETFPFCRGAVLFCLEDPSDFPLVVSREKIQISKTVVQRAVKGRVSILSKDILEDAALADAQSLAIAPIRSLVCVPIATEDRMMGLIYMDSRERGGFDERDLQLITAAGAIASLAMKSVLHTEWLAGENKRFQSEMEIEHRMIGESEQMKKVFQFISRVAPADSTVLITGESGTGKELVAQAIHRNSPRRDAPFVPINCAVLTETLLESELFGHEKGAFTGAIAQKKGKFELAGRGTLFLDEVAELGFPLQAKLLRVLQEREFERVGGTRPIKVDIRLIAATNKDLKEEIRQGKFRQDLHYRLNVIALEMPPLRSRTDDIPLLATYFLGKYAARTKRRILGISPEARACLMQYPWHGNVRELENAIERAVVLSTGDYLSPDDLPETVLESQSPGGIRLGNYHESVQVARKELILKAMEQAQGNFTEAAKLLGVHANYLHRLVRNLNLRPLLKK